MIQAMSADDTRKTRIPDPAPPSCGEPPPETCDHCGGTALEWVRCKLICRTCRQINKSCADL
jgi:hypothetical protein